MAAGLGKGLIGGVGVLFTSGVIKGRYSLTQAFVDADHQVTRQSHSQKCLFNFKRIVRCLSFFQD